MRKQDFTGKTKEELMAVLRELREKMDGFRFSLAEKKLKDVTQIGKVKRDIARLLTALRNTN